MLAGQLMMLDIVEAAAAGVRALRSRVDLIVALCHSGISRLASRPGEENAGLDLAGVEGIDAIVPRPSALTAAGRRISPE